LTGTPRLDLSLRGMPVPGQAQPDWLRMVDPALRPQEADRSPVLAIHYLRGRRPNQAPVEGGHLAFASPAETLLDLYELRLSSQADEFVQAVRSRGSHG
jgi:hypothetical protein